MGGSAIAVSESRRPAQALEVTEPRLIQRKIDFFWTRFDRWSIEKPFVNKPFVNKPLLDEPTFKNLGILKPITPTESLRLSIACSKFVIEL